MIWIERADRDVAGALTKMIRQVRPDYQPEPTAAIEDLRAVMTRELGGAAARSCSTTCAPVAP